MLPLPKLSTQPPLPPYGASAPARPENMALTTLLAVWSPLLSASLVDHEWLFVAAEREHALVINLAAPRSLRLGVG